MRNRFLTILKALIWLTIINQLFVSCHFDEVKSPIAGFKIIINYDIFSTFLSFRFIDAETGNLIGGVDDNKVAVTLSGNAAIAVVDQLGNRKEIHNSVYGLLSLALNPAAEWQPSTSNPISFQISATSEGYKPINQTINIDSIGKYEYVVMMEKTNVDALGVKTYTFNLNLDENRAMKDSLSFSSTANEMVFNLKRGTQFINSTGEIDTSTQVLLTFRIFNSTGKSGVAGSLINDMISVENVREKKAIDLYRIIQITATNNIGQQLATVSKPIEIKYKVESSAYNPITKSKIKTGDDVFSYLYLADKKAWQSTDSSPLQTDSLGNFSSTQILKMGIHAAGMHIGTCIADGTFAYQLKGLFPDFPVPSYIHFYRKYDSRFISSTKVNVPQYGGSQTLSFTGPEDTPLRFTFANYSSANSFTATPATVYFEAGCGSIGTLSTTFNSTAVPVSGTVKVSFKNDFPDSEFYVNAQIYSKSNNGLLWQKQFKISKTLNTFDVSTSLPEKTDVYIKLSPVNTQNSFDSAPISYEFNTSNSLGLSWTFSLDPIYVFVNFNFKFTRPTELSNQDFAIKADLTNTSTKKVDDTFTITEKPDQSNYILKRFLSNKNQYKINLKRTNNSSEFMINPYEFTTGTTLQSDYYFECELSPVVRKMVKLNLRVVCAQSEIIPTLHAYYRTVWDDNWKECDIVGGKVTLNCEINANYIIGLIIDGKMEITEYQIKEADANFIFELSDNQCSKMGW